MKRAIKTHRLLSAFVSLLAAALFLPGAASALGLAPDFDGRDRYIEIPHHDDLDPGLENWTLEFRIKLLSAVEGGATKFIAKRDGSGDAGGFYVGSRFAPACTEGNRWNLDFGRRLRTGEWIHVAAQVDRENNRLRVLVNGREATDAEFETDGAIRAESNLVIGGDSAGSLQGNHCLVRDVRVWKGVNLTPEEVRALAAGPVSPDAPGLVGYWPLDEGAGEIARDLAPGGNHGRFVGGAAWSPVEDPFSTNLPGFI